MDEQGFSAQGGMQQQQGGMQMQQQGQMGMPPAGMPPPAQHQGMPGETQDSIDASCVLPLASLPVSRGVF